MKKFTPLFLALFMCVSLSSQCVYLEGDMETFNDITLEIDEYGVLPEGTVLVPAGHASALRLFILFLTSVFIEVESQAYQDLWANGTGISQSEDAFTGESAARMSGDEVSNFVDLISVSLCDEVPDQLNIAIKHIGEGFDTLNILSIASDSLAVIFDDDIDLEAAGGYIDTSIVINGTDSDYSYLSIPYTNNGLSTPVDTISTFFILLGDTIPISMNQESYFLIDAISFGEPIVGIEETEIPANIYPNPTESFIMINTEVDVRYTVSDIAGMKIVSQNRFSENHSIDLSSFYNGTYFIRLEDRAGNYTVEKIIKH